MLNLLSCYNPGINWPAVNPLLWVRSKGNRVAFRLSEVSPCQPIRPVYRFIFFTFDQLISAMKKYFALVVSICFSIHLSAQNARALVAAEKAFEKSCLESGIRNGFLANVDSNGIDFTEK